MTRAVTSDVMMSSGQFMILMKPISAATPDSATISVIIP